MRRRAPKRCWSGVCVSHDFEMLCWRDVPDAYGVAGRDCAEHDAEDSAGADCRLRQDAEPETMERRLYLARKQFERMHEQGRGDGVHLLAVVADDCLQGDVYGRVCCREFYPDLASEEYVTPFALFHQRYATNTLPTWHRAQPGRTLAHNGEINTVWGNRARMAARDATLPVECKPVLTQGGTDSTSLDEAVELLSQNGRTMAEAVRMLLPPASDGHQTLVVSAVSRGLRGAVGWAGGDCVQRWAGCGRGARSEWAAALPVCDYRARAWWWRGRRRGWSISIRKR